MSLARLAPAVLVLPPFARGTPLLAMLESVTALFAAGVVVIGTEDEEVDKLLDPN